MSVDKAVKCSTNSSQSGRRQAGNVRRRMTSSSKRLTPTSQVLSGLQERQSLALRSVRTRRRRSRGDEGRWLTQDSGEGSLWARTQGRIVRVRRVEAAQGKVTGKWELVGVCKKVKYTRKKKKKRGACWGGGVIKKDKVHVQPRRRPDAEVIKTFTTCEVAGIKDGKGPRIDLQVGRKEGKKEGRK